MRLLSLVFVLSFLLSQQEPVIHSQEGTDSSSDQARLERDRQARERHNQAAIEINELAGRIRSEADASAIVDKIAEILADTLPPAWSTQGIRQRIAHAEYEAASNPSRLIPEQRIVDVWNSYVREIGATDEAIITVAELHNLRDAEFASSQYAWSGSRSHSIWRVPAIYALGSDGKVAEGCRAVETLRVLYDLDRIFDNLRGTRDRVRRGILISDEIRKLQENPPPKQKTTARLEVHVDNNPVRLAEYRYVQQHGPYIFGAVVEKLFDELLPAEG